MGIKIKIPEWLKFAADDALVDSNDMYPVFGYKSQNSFTTQYAKRLGNIPKHSRVIEYKTYRGRVVEKFLWRAKDVRDFIKNLERNNENK